MKEGACAWPFVVERRRLFLLLESAEESSFEVENMRLGGWQLPPTPGQKGKASEELSARKSCKERGRLRFAINGGTLASSFFSADGPCFSSSKEVLRSWICSIDFQKQFSLEPTNMRFLFTSILALSVSLCASMSSALVIDNFVIGQGGLGADNSIPDVNGSGGTFTPGNILGLERDVRLQRTGVPIGNLPSTVSFFSTPYPYVQIVPGNSSNVDVTFQWDGFLDGTKNVLDPTGLIPVANLIGPGSNLISVTASNGASPTTAVFTIRDSSDIITTNTLVIPPGFNGDLQFLFSDFSTPANFSQVEALQLKLSVPLGTTFYLSGILQSEYIFFGTPEPSTISLLLPLLAGMACRRRRKLLAKST